MSSLDLKRGTAVIWIQRQEKLGKATMILGIVQASVDSDRVTIEVVEPDNNERVLVTVPAGQVQPLQGLRFY